MDIYRVFAWDGQALGVTPGGPLYVPRHKQGKGRHDIPHKDGILYCSLDPTSAIAEAIKPFRGGARLADPDFIRADDTRLSFVKLDLKEAANLVDLNKTEQLSLFAINPADITSRDRRITQYHAEKIFDSDANGFIWWSALNAQWRNLTLFESRVIKFLKVSEHITPLRIDLSELREAAFEIGVVIEK